MDVYVSKKLSDCLQTAHEIHEYAVLGNVQRCRILAEKLIGKLDECVGDTLKAPGVDATKE